MEIEIVEGNFKIRSLILDDVFRMKEWGIHETPLLADYNFPKMTDSEIKRWYRFKTLNPFNKYLGILVDDRLIGYMGLKNIKIIKKESTLGIVFDPNYVNMGYGSKTLKLFLSYYFNELNMKIMYLEVAKFNERAMRVYKKVGFETTSYYLEEFFDQNLNLNNSYYLDAKTSFVIKDEKIYNYIYKMKVDREDFQS